MNGDTSPQTAPAGFPLGFAIEGSEPGTGAFVALFRTIDTAYCAIVTRLVEVGKSEEARDDDHLLARELLRKAVELDCQRPHLVETKVGPYAYRIREALP